MRCDEVLNQLNARADGELRAEVAAGLDAHLAECSQCRSAAEGLQTIDAELRSAFAGRRAAASRLAESVAAKVRALAGSPVSIATQVAAAPAPRLAWTQMLAGLAAGFLLAVALFRPWESKSVEIAALPPIEPVARLAVASGPVEYRYATQVESFACPTGAAIGRDSIVSTGPTARCEISMDDGSALRLDCNTEVKLLKPGIVEAKRGRFCSTSPPGRKGLEIQSVGSTIVARPAAQLAFACEPQGARLIVVNGAADVQNGQKSVEVGPGQQLRIVQGKVEGEPDWCDASLETAWVNSVLALRSSEHPELVERVKQLLANVGAAKLSYLYEDELRRLGDDGVPPLLAYLASTRDTPKIAERVTAARIVADVAGSRWIPDLIGLLTDANAEVRAHAARGLERLTGRDQGCDAQTWQSKPWSSCQDAHQQWIKWWGANRDRYPAARRDIPATKSPSL